MDKINFIDLKDSDLTNLTENLKQNIEFQTIQLFNPIYLNYDKFEDVGNTTLKSKYLIKNILDNSNNLEKDDNNPYIKTFVKAEIINQHTSQTHIKELFCKYAPIIDAVDEALKSKNDCIDPRLPSLYYNNINHKINNFQNSAYIDAFFTFLGSKLTESGKCPTFPLFYGTFSGIKNNYYYDLSEDYSQIRFQNQFQANLNTNQFELKIKNINHNDKGDLPITEEMELIDNFEFNSLDDIIDDELIETINTSHENDEIATIGALDIDVNYKFENIINGNIDTIKYINIPNFPVQVIFLEKLEQTLEDLINDDDYTISTDEWKSILFQICFGLSVAQKRFDFVHNDLHCENIMFQKTDLEYLYFEFENNKYKIPTFGKVVKIIDFGRATFYHNDTIYFSDQFDEDGDAEEQYDYPTDNSFKGCKIKPNYSFDLARLTSTIIHTFENGSELYKLVKTWITDKHGYFLMNDPDDFDLYRNIARNMKNAVPKKQLKKPIFKQFIVSDTPGTTFVYKY